MDRFIDEPEKVIDTVKKYLKSSLDRFIETNLPLNALKRHYLKSSLDRFIGVAGGPLEQFSTIFKIQFG